MSKEKKIGTEETTKLEFEVENLYLRIVGPYLPERIVKIWRENCMAMDRYRGEKSITKSTILYPAELGVVYLLDHLPWEVLLSWNAYEDQHNQIQLIHYADIKFNDQLGRGMRRRQKPDRLLPELNVTVQGYRKTL